MVNVGSRQTQRDRTEARSGGGFGEPNAAGKQCFVRKEVVLCKLTVPVANEVVSSD
jgi:hypothetical protein